MGLSVRSYSPEVRKHLLSAIARVTKAEADAAGVEKPPAIEPDGGTNAVYNDPKLTERVRASLQQALGAANVEEGKPSMASDDFSDFATDGVPEVMVRLGAANPQKFAEAKAGGKRLPSNHSPFFAPDAEPTLRTAIDAEVAVLRGLFR